MQGILIVDKPAGFTSFDVIAKLRGICQTRKIGHSGTLDPMATGVLPVFIGGASKAVDMQQDHTKTYEATLLLGTRTDTGDVTGSILETAPVPQGVDEAAVRAVLPRFVGESMQLPPMYSAVKVGGQPLYKAARAGKTVERTPRPIVVYDIELLAGGVAPDAFFGGRSVAGEPQENEKMRGTAPISLQHLYTLRIHCGKGTYVRVLLEDIAAALGTVGTMQALRRTQAGVYTLDGAHTLEEIQTAKNKGTLETLLHRVDTVFAHLPAVQVDELTRERLYNGAPTYRFPAADGAYRAYADETFLGVCEVENAILRAKKLFVERD